MSLILDALKKSEQQRQREKAPSLQSIHQSVSVAPKKTFQPWWLLAAFVVVCNFAFFGYWFWQQQHQQITPASAQAPKKPVDAQPIPQSDPQVEVKQSEATAQDIQAEFTKISPRGAAPQTSLADTSQRVEEISELPDSVRNNLPAMTFSFHVYSENPEQRTIIINDRRVREGEEVSPGLRLQAITQDGVILLFEQHRIHISVLSDW